MSGLYVKLDANIFSDDRIIECSTSAQLLYIRGLCVAKQIETDGRLTRAQVCQSPPIRRLGSVIDELVQCGLWTTDDGNFYQITSWLDHNMSAAEIEDRRSDLRIKRSEAGKRGGIASGQSRNKRSRSEATTKQIASTIERSNEANVEATERESERKTTTRDSRFAECVKSIAHELSMGELIANPGGFRTWKVRELSAEQSQDGKAIDAWLVTHPDATVEDVRDAYLQYQIVGTENYRPAFSAMWGTIDYGADRAVVDYSELEELEVAIP